MAGAQHPSRHIQMSGTGDVVITEIRKSAAVLVLDASFAGRVFVHDAAGALLVELNKPAGREVAIGLDAGGYRIFVVGEAGAREAQVKLEDGKSVVLGRDDFAKVARVPATVRGTAAPINAGWGRASGRFGWRLEFSGGLAAIDPADLNLRGTFDRMYSQYYGYDYMAYRVSQGEIASFTRTTGGKTSGRWGGRCRSSSASGGAWPAGWTCRSASPISPAPGAPRSLTITRSPNSAARRWTTSTAMTNIR